ncbi:unnamed protein product, partial [Ectocarpus sp. 8 AP-2014]
QILRTEKEKTARLQEALWQEGGTKREWEMLTQASSLLKQRLESTERIRNRQKELIRELQAVEADIAFANAGNMAGLVSTDPLPNLSPPLPPPPPPALPPTARRRKASSSSLLAHRRGSDTERHHAVDERCGRRSRGGASDRARTPLRGKYGEQRRPPPTGTKSAKSDDFPAGRAAAVELEDDGGGGGGGTRLGRAAASAPVRTVGRAAAVRPERPRRSGGPADGATKSGISATGARKSSEGAVASKAGRTQTGRTSSSTIDSSSADTKARRAEVDRKSKSATTATAQSRHRAATSS